MRYAQARTDVYCIQSTLSDVQTFLCFSFLNYYSGVTLYVAVTEVRRRLSLDRQIQYKTPDTRKVIYSVDWLFSRVVSIMAF